MVDVEIQRVFGAFTTCAQLLSLYDRLRLYGPTSFYIILIEETISDIKAFLILFVMALFAFGIPMLFLNYNRQSRFEELDEDID